MWARRAFTTVVPKRVPKTAPYNYALATPCGNKQSPKAVTFRCSSSFPENNLESPDYHCTSLVKTSDHPAYLTGLLLPQSHRSSFFALRAFNVSTGMIKDLTKRGNEDVVKSKLDWWREGVSLCYDVKDGVIGEEELENYSHFRHPVIISLKKAILTNPYFTRRLFEIVLNSRRQTLGLPQFTTLEDLVKHSYSIYGSMLKLECEIVEEGSDELDLILDHLGVALGVAKNIKYMKQLVQVGEIAVPSDIAREGKVDMKMIVDDGEDVKGAVYKMACEGKEHLDQAREKLEKVKGVGKDVEAFLIEGLEAKRVYENLEKNDFLYSESEQFWDSLPVRMARGRLTRSTPF